MFDANVSALQALPALELPEIGGGADSCSVTCSGSQSCGATCVATQAMQE